jgi:hypothetical protein
MINTASAIYTCLQQAIIIKKKRPENGMVLMAKERPS